MHFLHSCGLRDVEFVLNELFEVHFRGHLHCGSMGHHALQNLIHIDLSGFYPDGRHGEHCLLVVFERGMVLQMELHGLLNGTSSLHTSCFGVPILIRKVEGGASCLVLLF